MSEPVFDRKPQLRVAMPLDEAPARPSLVPDDVWQSYQSELAHDEEAAGADDADLLDDVDQVETGAEHAFTATEPADLEVALLALSQADLFASMGRPGLGHLARAATFGRVRPGELLFVEGSHASSFFVVLAGLVDVHRRRDGRELSLRQIPGGEALGLFGMLSGKTRAASARAVTATQVLEIPGSALNGLIQKDGGLRERLVRFYRARLLEGFFGSNRLFADFNAQVRSRVIARFGERRLRAGEAIIQPGEVSNLFAAVLTGSLLLEGWVRPGSPPKTYQLDAGQFVASTAAFSGAPSRMRVWAPEDATLILIEQRALGELTREFPALRTLPSRLASQARRVERDIYCGHLGIPGI